MANNYLLNVSAIRFDRCCHSLYGNPHFYLTVTTVNGDTFQVKTAVNGSIGYGLENYGVSRYRSGFQAVKGHFISLSCHDTKTGNIIADFVED